MNRDDVLTFCSRLPGAVEDYPFGDEVAVYKAGGRMFALIMLEGSPGFVNLKCDPELALELPARYPAVRPGYHASAGAPFDLVICAPACHGLRRLVMPLVVRGGG